MSLVLKLQSLATRIGEEIKILRSQKQDTLVSGTNIKTVNGESLLGSGDINVQGADYDDLTSGYYPMADDNADLADGAIFQNQSGNIGIGTETPHTVYSTKSLELAGQNGALLALRSLYNGKVSIIGDLLNNLFIYAAGKLTFRTSEGSSGDALVIDEAGKVGIGTANPSNVLTVSGGNTQGITIVSTNNANLDLFSTAVGSRNFRIANKYSRDNLFEIMRSTSSNAYPTTSVLAIDGTNGNVGIGTTSPGYKLDVVGGSVGISNSVANSSVGFFLKDTSGSTKQWNFEVIGASVSGRAGNFEITEAGIANQMVIKPGGNTAFGYNDPGTAKLAINGNVGIGTTSPSEKLDVNGKIKATSIQATSGAGVGKIMKSDANGNGNWADDEYVNDLDDRLSDARTPTDNSVSYAKISSDLTSVQAISTTVIDWSVAAIRTKTITEDTAFTFSNLQANKVITLILTGDYVITFPAYMDADHLISGEYDGTAVNYIRIHCTNSAQGSEEVWWAIKTAGV